MYIYEAKVIRVVDGDTLIVDIDLGFHVWLRNQSIRLSDIDAPESRTTDLDVKAAGLVSKDVLKELCPPESIIKIHTAFDDKYGRIAAKVENEDGVKVNTYLVRNNYAVAYDGGDRELLEEQHKRNFDILKNRGEL